MMVTQRHACQGFVSRSKLLAGICVKAFKVALLAHVRIRKDLNSPAGLCSRYTCIVHLYPT